MATTNLSKTTVYESLYLISLATQQITHHLERLKAANILAPKPAELRKLAVNQLRAEIAAAAITNLVSLEMADAYRQEKGHLRLEKAVGKAQILKRNSSCHERSGHSAGPSFFHVSIFSMSLGLRFRILPFNYQFTQLQNELGVNLVLNAVR